MNSTANAGMQLYTVANSGYAFGTGDFTIEFWYYPVSFPSANMWDFRTEGNSVCPDIGINGSGVLSLFVSNTTVITGSTLSIDQWYHLALSRVSGTSRMFIDGTQSGSDYTDSNNYVQNGFSLGNSNSVNTGNIGNAGGNGYVSEVRITKGVGRYSTTFTRPATRFADY